MCNFRSNLVYYMLNSPRVMSAQAIYQAYVHRSLAQLVTTDMILIVFDLLTLMFVGFCVDYV
jgi:hypothetical protein